MKDYDEPPRRNGNKWPEIENKDHILDEKEETNGIITTQDEIDAYNIVRGIAAEVINPGRVYMRDQKGFCGINIDDNRSRTIVKLYFNILEDMSFEIISKSGEAVPKIPIVELSEIYQHADKIKEAVRHCIA